MSSFLLRYAWSENEMQMLCPHPLFQKKAVFDLLYLYLPFWSVSFLLVSSISFAVCTFPVCIRWHFPFKFLSPFSEQFLCFGTGYLKSILFHHVMAILLKQLLLCWFLHCFAEASLGFRTVHPRDVVDTNSWVLEHLCLSVALMLHYVLALYFASELPITMRFWM